MIRRRGDASVPGERVVVLDEAKIVSLRREGLTQKLIAERFRTSHERIGRILKRHGLSGRQP